MDRWIKSHRIGLAAYTLFVSPLDEVRYEQALYLLSDYLLEEPGQDPDDRQAFFLSLPPSVLELLARALKAESQALTQTQKDK